MKGIFDYDHCDPRFYKGTSSATSQSIPQMTVKEMLALMDEFKQKAEQSDRDIMASLKAWCQATICHECGRKPKVLRDYRPGAPTIFACSHLVVAIKTKFKTVESLTSPPAFGVPLAGIWIETLDI